MFTVQQYGTSEKEAQPSRTLLFNYKTKKIVLEVGEQKRFDTISPTFNHFITGIDPARGIVDCGSVDARKLYAHLAKRSDI